jgi:Pyruvate/2-oxoacid:ferredoxin oxidoreductase delta subunit
MCEFCLKHGEGEKWYLQAKNYSDDLLNDIRRRKFIEAFSDPERISKAAAHSAKRTERLRNAPVFIRNILSRLVTRKMKRMHFGQVIPIEEVEKIFAFTNCIVRVACICRKAILGKEKRYCYGVSLSPDSRFGDVIKGLDKSYQDGPDTTESETLTREEAIAAFRAHELEGLCHTVWTFETPFIGGICNCDRSDCLAMRSTVTHATPVMFRAEFVAGINQEECNGCRECMRLCQFGAIAYSAATRKTVIDQRWCYGCGICRSVCNRNAIRLEERAISPVAADIW